MALVCMPFGPVFAPSLGLSLLRAGLAEHHFDARVHYFSIRFAEAIGQAFYTDISTEGRPALEDLAGEWLFNGALFGAAASAEGRYVEEMLRGYYSDALITRLLRTRERVDDFLDQSLDTLLRENAGIVGFTSTFQQHVASLALARRLKQASPSTFVVFGGCNCEGVMGAETVRSFPFVDAALSGEADVVFPSLVRRVLHGDSAAGLPGVRTRACIEEDFAAGVFGNGPMVHDMDSLPIPDYRDYFAQFKASRYEREWQPAMFVETARGCWWGERVHCTFCGLNGSTLRFRSKSPARAVWEMRALMRRHPGCDIVAVDNVLDRKYFDQALPALAKRRRGVSISYETRSDLAKLQVRRLRAAGVGIQAGIESLSDLVLKLMRKGVTGLQNIQLLKWCKEVGVPVRWNFIWGFPGEPPEEYQRLARLVPLLAHLPPPFADAQIRLDRFSPNFADAERLGLVDVKPLPAYKYVYRLPAAAIANLAGHFTYRYADGRDVDRYTRRLVREIVKWRRAAPTCDLVSLDAGDHLVIVDTRPVSRATLRVLGGLARLLYRECDAVRDIVQLAAAATAVEAGPAAGSVEGILAGLVAEGLLLQQGTRYLSLAIPVGEYRPSVTTNRRFANAVSNLGAQHGKAWIVPTENGAAGTSACRRSRRKVRVPCLDAVRLRIDAQGQLVIEQSDGTQPNRKERIWQSGSRAGKAREGRR